MTYEHMMTTIKLRIELLGRLAMVRAAELWDVQLVHLFSLLPAELVHAEAEPGAALDSLEVAVGAAAGLFT